MMIVPMLRAGMTYEQIAPSFDRSPGTIKRWAAHPDVVAALGEAHEQALAVANEDALDVARQAWRTLSALMDDEDVDPRVRLDAAKTVLSRKGEPEATKSESSVETRGTGLSLHIVATEAARVLEMTEDEG